MRFRATRILYRMYGGFWADLGLLIGPLVLTTFFVQAVMAIGHLQNTWWSFAVSAAMGLFYGAVMPDAVRERRTEIWKKQHDDH